MDKLNKISRLTLLELRAFARSKGWNNYSKQKKSDLIDRILKADLLDEVICKKYNPKHLTKDELYEFLKNQGITGCPHMENGSRCECMETLTQSASTPVTTTPVVKKKPTVNLIPFVLESESSFENFELF